GVSVKTANDNIFHQTQVAGQSWASYEESMTTNCQANSGFYKAGHNPAYWYTDLRSPTDTCSKYDVPMSPSLDYAISSDSLPTFCWPTPNACNDMHYLAGCPQASIQSIAAGDDWLAAMVPRLTAMPSYQRGETLIVVTWDEGDGKDVDGTDCTSPAV